MRVGKRDWTGEGGWRGLRDATAVPRAVVPFASRGILFANCPFALVSFDGEGGGGFDSDGSPLLPAAAAAVDLVTLTGRSEAGALVLEARVEAGFGFVRRTGGATASDGRTSSFASSASDYSRARDVRLAAGVLRG